MKKKFLYPFAALLPLFSACSLAGDVDLILPMQSVITSIRPLTAKGGDTLTIYGQHMLIDTSIEKITINARIAEIVDTTADSIKVIVPPLLGSGELNIVVGNNTFETPYFEYQYEVIVTTIAGSGTVGIADGAASQSAFNCPWGIDVDTNGDLYIADCYNRLIRKYNAADSTVSTIDIPLNIGSSTFYSPYNIFLDKSTHDLYLTDFNAHVIKVNSVYDFSTVYNGDLGLAGIAMGPDGYLYIGNNNTGDILKMNTAGQDTSVFASGLYLPRKIIFDTDGNLYVGAYDNAPVVKKITGNGIISNAGIDTEWEGWEMARDTAGNFYLADHVNNRIRKIDTRGVVTTIAGSGTAADVDGIGLNASFDGPQGITIDGQGNLYVTTYNYEASTGNKIRKITFR